MGVLLLSVDEEWWGGAESLISGKLKSHLLFITSAKIPKREGNISPSSLYGPGVNQANEEGRRFQDFLLSSQWFEGFPSDVPQLRWLI